MKHTQIAIVGAGAVGVTAAYALLLNQVGGEILLVDINTEHTAGEILDLQDAAGFTNFSGVRQATLAEAASADLVIVTAGIAQHPGQTRIDLLQENANVMKRIATGLENLSPSSVVLVASNPVDVMTQCLQHFLPLPKNQVIGSGTLLDSQRFRGFIAETLNISTSSIHAFILGEHGDSQFPAWSLAQISGVPLSNYPGIDTEKQQYIADKTKRKAYEIINLKGATYYGIASCISKIASCILNNKRQILPVSSYIDTLGTCLSLPVIVGEQGASQPLPIHLSASEKRSLEASAALIKKSFHALTL